MLTWLKFLTPAMILGIFLFWLHVDEVTAQYSCASQTTITTAECNALVDLYNSTDGTNWDDNTGWLSAGNPCDWYGVACWKEHYNSSLDAVAWLRLNSNGLQGTIPASIGNMIYLDRLELADNQLSGSIPAAMGNLEWVWWFDLSRNNLSGTIPSGLAFIDRLRNMNLSYNSLQGSIPPEFGSSTYLEALLLNHNQLTGSLPAGLSSSGTLAVLALNHNNLSGSLPGAITTIGTLQQLYLHENDLTGALPVGWSSGLEVIDLSGNSFNQSIPSQLVQLPGLRDLFLQGNRLTGNVPSAITSSSSLYTVELDYNGLSAGSTVNAYLENLDWAWSATQTVPVTNITGELNSTTSALVSWTPVDYTEDSGAYIVFIYNTATSTYDEVGRVDDKTASSLVVSNLSPNTTYNALIRTVTDPHSYNDNNVARATTFTIDMTLYADVNNDNIISPVDVMFVINRIGQAATGGNEAADINNDGQISEADVQMVLDVMGP